MAATAVQLMKIERDPAVMPQPGDVARAGGLCRWIVKAETGRIFIDGGRTRYWMNLPAWRHWCAITKPRFEWRDPAQSYHVKHFHRNLLTLKIGP